MILVTGATGMVGGNLLWQLLQKNERVRAIRRISSSLQPLKTIFGFYTAQPDVFLERIDWITADVLDENSLNNACNNISIVYHCAAVVSLSKSSSTLTNININGTRNVVNACMRNNVAKLCFVSSIAACGKGAKGELITEETTWVESPNRSMYSKSKYYAEQEVVKGIRNGLNAVIVNPGVILGVSGTNTGSSELFYRVKKGIPFYTNGGSGYIDVRDVVKCMIQLTNSTVTGNRFILVAENRSNKEIMSWMAVGFGTKKPFIKLSKTTLFLVGFVVELFSKLVHVNPIIDRNISITATSREYYSSSKIKNQLGINFIPIEKCIQEYCNYSNSDI